MSSSSNDLKEIWTTISGFIKESTNISSTAFNLWFSDLDFVSLSSSEAVFSTSNEMKQQVIQDRYSDLIASQLIDTIGYQPAVKIIVRSSGNGTISSDTGRSIFSSVQAETSSLINPEYTFDNFIVGDSNKFAYATAQAVAKNPGYAYNPFMIYGNSGLGKTHLMCAIANQILQDSPSTKILYVKGDEFTNQLIESMKNKTTSQFHEKFRQTDILMIDDIHFIAGKTSTEEEFFHTFNALYEKHKQIIVTSDRPPKDMPTLENRIKSRLEAGLLADIGLPDYELRLAILQQKSQMIDLTLSDSVLAFLAENLHSNIRQIEGVVKKLRASQFVSESPITVSSVKDSISEFLRDTEDTNDIVNKIISSTSLHYNVSEPDIIGKSRQKEIKTARNAAMYIIREITDLSLNDIGLMFNRDHSTIYSNIQAISSEIQTDPSLAAAIKDIIKEVKG